MSHPSIPLPQQIVVLVTEDEAVGDAMDEILGALGGFDLIVEGSEERAFEVARTCTGAMFVFHVSGARPMGVAFRRARSIDPLLHGIAMGVCADELESIPVALEDLPALALPVQASALRRFLAQLELAPPISMR